MLGLTGKRFIALWIENSCSAFIPLSQQAAEPSGSSSYLWWCSCPLVTIVISLMEPLFWWLCFSEPRSVQLEFCYTFTALQKNHVRVCVKGKCGTLCGAAKWWNSDLRNQNPKGKVHMPEPLFKASRVLLTYLFLKPMVIAYMLLSKQRKQRTLKFSKDHWTIPLKMMMKIITHSNGLAWKMWFFGNVTLSLKQPFRNSREIFKVGGWSS